ncbi:MAG: hypothetical protein E5W19_28185 [Mesorhizobium sp.]|nr:MAG: hypothetical protein E5W19_28185 [Mesorhizobium sp.]
MAIMLGGDIDFVVSRTEDPGWVGVVMRFLFSQPELVNLALLVGGLLLIYWDVRRNRPRPPAQSIPISITKIAEPGWGRQSGLSTLVNFTAADGQSSQRELHAAHLGIRPVFISNVSLDRSVTLRFSLAVVDGKGNVRMFPGDGKDRWGHVMGVHDFGAKIEKQRGISPTKYILSPITIAPQTTVDGWLQFIETMIDFDSDDEFDKKTSSHFLEGVLGSGSDTFKYRLDIEDVISGVEISIPLPSDGYRGS